MEQRESFFYSRAKKQSLYVYQVMVDFFLRQKFDSVILENEFKINECDNCVYVKYTNKGYVILCLNIGDMIIFLFGRNNEMIKSTHKKIELEICHEKIVSC